jgi:ribosomal protein S18 acetylase RimI-like enzyme
MSDAHSASIREYRQDDRQAVRACVVELQEFERTIDPRLRPGEDMADGYFDSIQQRCREAAGRIFVADLDGHVVGFVAVLAHEPFTQLDDPPGTYGFVSDLVVRAAHRSQGIGRQLLERAEAFARNAGAKELRICVLAENTAARQLYLKAAFEPHQEILVKPL